MLADGGGSKRDRGSRVCTTSSVSNEDIFSMVNTSKRFLDDKGVLITRRLGQNPTSLNSLLVPQGNLPRELHPIEPFFLLARSPSPEW